MIIARTTLHVTGWVTVIVAQGQPEVHVFLGAQMGLAAYHIADEDPTGDPHYHGSTTFDPGSGYGWHAGASIRTGTDEVEFCGSIIFITQPITSSYSRSEQTIALGGGNTTKYEGTVEEKFTVLEAPLQLSVAPIPSMRLELGFSPWALVKVEHRDFGESSHVSWTMDTPPQSSSSTYDERDQSFRSYSKFGLSTVIGMSVLTKRRISVSASCSISLTPIYLNRDPYAGHLTTLRCALGYLLKRP